MFLSLANGCSYAKVILLNMSHAMADLYYATLYCIYICLYIFFFYIVFSSFLIITVKTKGNNTIHYSLASLNVRVI